MITISFANPKGGTGKTTAALILAEQIADRGGRVGIIDCDPNANIVRWRDERDELGLEQPFHIEAIGDPQEFDTQIDGMEPYYDYLLIDLEGTASEVVSTAVALSDLVLIPLTPSYMEARQAQRAVSIVRKASRITRKDILAKLVFTRTNSAVRARDESELRKTIAQAGIGVVGAEIMTRRAFSSMFQDARTLSELRGIAAARCEGATKSARERTLKPFDGAIENARHYAGAVLSEVEVMLDAA